MAERWAYGPLGLTPDQFVMLTARDFERMCAGYRWREERRADDLAYLAAHVMNASGHLKRAVSVADLLGRAPGTSRVDGYAPDTPEPSRRRTTDEELGF